jgi:DNA-binding NarL/FixJ family response regulator
LEILSGKSIALPLCPSCPLAHRILIVEDHEWAREMLARMLALQPGIEVAHAVSSAAEALAWLPGDADAVLLDLALGDVTDFSLLRTIRQRWPELPCIMLSGKPAVEYAAQAQEAGAAQFVEKGDAPALLAALYDTLGPAP